MDKIITLREASELSGYNQDYLGSLIRNKTIGGQKMGRNWFVTERTLLEFMKQKNLQIDEEKLQDASSDSPLIVNDSDFRERAKRRPKIQILKIIIALAILAFAVTLLLSLLAGFLADSRKNEGSDNGLMEVKTYYREDNSDVSPPLK
jgi:hypothetical protein